ncbi:sugar-binding domain-containing protein [Lacibacter sediminis]|uniref:Glycoside hydrolase family 2 protein n=1 Tax=Lacibacter sediminis TaxID=2760713 RepID=A0A7G5XJM2_9BACT|nr:sugar-binding domain-containing protein [Lacibacter sediminis]QNA45675.1 glycoside hydrolase family 2 protein [Lacibacter sediminis]
MKLIKNILLVVALLLSLISSAQVRSIVDFNNGWKFFLGNDSLASNANYNDSKWRSLNLPHDWSIESNFSSSFPATNQGGALPGGTGWYRKTFTVPLSFKNRITRIEFDGVYKNSEVWINGHYLGKRPYGYINFSYDLTPHLNYGKPNVIAVKVDNSLQPDSRWYSGSGIYRDLKLVSTNNIALAEAGVFITTPVINKNKATVSVKYNVSNTGNQKEIVKLYTDVYDATGKKVATSKHIVLRSIPVGGYSYADELQINTPLLWSTAKPYLYKAVTRIERNGQLIDEVKTTFGIRSFHFDAANGFFLNNQPLKIQGVCMHHDLGALGAAYNHAAAKRQLKILKEMGVNAIRFSHNPPAAALLDLCDEMGFLVQVEAFDMWKKKKNKFDYNLYFDEWHERDVQAMVLRDRNHPSVFMWSIGNEIREQFDSTGTTIAKRLVDLIKAIDTTRPVTCALTENFPEKNFIWKSGALDVLGFNYKLYDYAELPNRFPGQSFVATETASALSSRGSYDMPSDSNRLWPPDGKTPTVKGNADMSVSAYDHVYAYWGSSHEAALLAVNKYKFMSGMFVWSGFDFIGEPVPYAWPARSSYYGIVDLAGFPKDVYYLYQSEWTTKPVLYLFPHWNHNNGDTVDVWSYYNNADEVELFLNGKSLGSKSKPNDVLHVKWRVPYQPGVIKAISKKNGKAILTKEIRTSGTPAKIQLVADRTKIKANGTDLSFITVKLLDKDGNPVPDADQLIEFSVTGPGFLAGTDNGFPADSTSLKNHKRKTWKGMALAIIQSQQKKGNITVTAKSAGLGMSVISLKSE